jgi:hypothetical protein
VTARLCRDGHDSGNSNVQRTASINILLCGFGLLLTAGIVAAAEQPPWPSALHAARASVQAADNKAAATVSAWNQLRKDYPVECDWLTQDHGGPIDELLTKAAGNADLERQLIARALKELPAASPLHARLDFCGVFSYVAHLASPSTFQRRTGVSAQHNSGIMLGRGRFVSLFSPEVRPCLINFLHVPLQ